MNYVIGKLIDRMVFQPFREPTYDFVTVGDELKLKLRYRNEIMNDAEVGYCSTAIGSRIAYLFVRSAHRPSKAGILYSNGNSGDIGFIYNEIIQLATETCCDVLAYDYTGFGLSSRRAPSERNFYADAEAAVNELDERFGYAAADTILYGFSLGTAACVMMAADEQRRFAGIILQSPMLSVGRVIFGEEFVSRYDRFNNASRAPCVRCPAMIVHDELDDIVPFSHAIALWRLLPSADRLVVTRGFGHSVPFRRILPAIRRFVEVTTAPDHCES